MGRPKAPPRRKTDPAKPPNGYRSRLTVNNHRVITIDWFAVKGRDQEWYDKTVKIMGLRKFNREFGRDWTSSEGRVFYPEAVDWDATLIRKIPGAISGLPIIRGWDFGYHHPACVWLQYDPAQHHVWVLNELMPEDVDTYVFRDLVLYLSGQMEHRELSEHAKRWVQRLDESGKYPKSPWFKPSATRQFIDFSGHEATKTTASVQGEDAARQDAKVLEEKGIFLSHPWVKVKARENVLRSLLLPREDDPDIPHIFFDPACPTLTQGVQGGIVYAKPTDKNPSPDEPMSDGFFEHLHDALGYALVNHVPIVRSKEPPRSSAYDGRSTRLAIPRTGHQLPTRRERAELEEMADDQDMGYNETRPTVNQATYRRGDRR